MGQDETHHLLMIVDDDPVTRRALGTLLLRQGWRVRSAATVAEAADLLDHGLVPNGLILDLMLPDGEGVAILRKIRDAGLGTHVAVCTGSSDPMLLIRARALEPDLLLIKPVDADVICKLCDGWSRPIELSLPHQDPRHPAPASEALTHL